MEESPDSNIPGIPSEPLLQLSLPEGAKFPGIQGSGGEGYILMEEEQLKRMLAWQREKEAGDHAGGEDPREEAMFMYEMKPEVGPAGIQASLEGRATGGLVEDEERGQMQTQQTLNHSKKRLIVKMDPKRLKKGRQPQGNGDITQHPRSKQPLRGVKPTPVGLNKTTPLSQDARKRVVDSMQSQGLKYVIQKKPKRKRKKVRRLKWGKENLVISIHRKGELVRVVMMKEAPYLCTKCGLTFNRTAALKEHAETEHSYIEPRGGPSNEIMPMAIIQRSFPKRPKNLEPQEGSLPVVKQEPIDSEAPEQSSSHNLQSIKPSSTNVSDSEDSDDALNDIDDIPMSENDNDDEDPMDDDDNNDDIDGLKKEQEQDENQQSNRPKRKAKFEAIHLSNPVSTQSDGNSAEGTETRALPQPPRKRKRPAKSRNHMGKKCHSCPIYFRSSYEMKAHLADKHGEYNSREQALEYWAKENEVSGDGDGEEEHEVLMCSRCEVYFNDQAAATGHMRKHCGVEGIKCDVCIEAIQMWREDRFEELGHLNEVKYGEGGNRRNNPRKEARVEDVDGCEESSEESKQELRVEEMYSRSMERANKVCKNDLFLVTCGDCGEEFYRRDHLVTHYRWHKQHPCKECGFEFLTMNDLQRHTSEVHKIGFFKCFFCPKRYWNCGKLNFHMIGHLGLFQCIVCGYTAMCKETLRKHISDFIDRPEHKECSEEDRVKYSYNNPYVSRGGKGAKRIRKKGSRVRKVQRLEGDPSIDPKTNRFLCPNCPLTLKTKPSLLNHIHIKHSAEPVPYTHMCTYCGKGFRNQTHVRYHERQHTGEKTFKCEKCHKSYADPSTLKVHMHTHATEKPFLCEYCPSAFPTEIYLNAHRRVHTRPFKCPQCDLGFAQVAARRNHLKKVHGIEDKPKTSKDNRMNLPQVPAMIAEEVLDMVSEARNPLQYSTDFFGGDGLTNA